MICGPPIKINPSSPVAIGSRESGSTIRNSVPLNALPTVPGLLRNFSGFEPVAAISGKLTDAEYKNFIPKVEAVINEFGAIKLYVDMLDMAGWEWRVAWDDFAFGIKHWNNFTKLALVGEKRWEKFSAQVADKINKAEVRFFDRKETYLYKALFL